MPHGELFIGILVSLACFVVHAVIMATLTRTTHRAASATRDMSSIPRLVLVMMVAVTVIMAAHLAEVGVWALTYAALSAVPNQADPFYFAFVNYTTLGYGDVLPIAYWRLLGPMAAMNGILLFGWSTAVIYDVLRTIHQFTPMQVTPAGSSR